MKKASGILVTKNDDYNYIDRFIDFLERIINIILMAYERLTGKKATSTDATGTNA